MGIASGETITEAPMTHSNDTTSVSDRQVDVWEGPPPLYITVDRPARAILIGFFPHPCKEGIVGETPHSVIKEPGITLSNPKFFF